MDTTDGSRASDAERERTAERLRGAVGEGRLDLTEYDERVRTAYAAVTRGELARVTADLAAPPVPVGGPITAKPARAGEWAEAWRGWLVGALIMIGIWAATSLFGDDGPSPFWPVFPVGIWAAVLIVSMATGQRPHRGCAGARRAAGAVRPPR